MCSRPSVPPARVSKRRRGSKTGCGPQNAYARLAPEEIWLFGSRAEGRARPDSDYDLLAVLSDDAPDSALDLMKAWELTCGLGVPADLVPCTRSDFEADKDEVGTLARAAYHRGRRIYERRA
ncbi:nucleotidyltransferase domain-containing protein [Sorangium sp. So ce204]|uniref:nucleotidyltransferase domain-containing protein n=1 Tax=Sorangium sp. So ce204 TaxID=3133288 RepID=UPI003F63AC0A